MATTTQKQLVAPQALTAAVVTYYTVPANTVAIVTAGALSNSTGGAVACSVYIVPSGGTAGTSNKTIPARSIANNDTDLCPELLGQRLPAGTTIQAVGNGVSFVLSGEEVA